MEKIKDVTLYLNAAALILLHLCQLRTVSTQIPPPTMSFPVASSRLARKPYKSRHFFSAFQRYISVSASLRAPPAGPLCVQAHTRKKPILNHRGLQTASRRFATTISEPQKSTHYTLFPLTLPAGPPPKGPFDINLQTLKREFLQLQAKAHPDRHSGPDKARAEGTSALINEAYNTLSSPLLRAQYLLHLQGIDVAENETAKIDDEELLMEVLEAREVIESAEDEGGLGEVKQANAARIVQSERVIADLCRKGDWEAVKDEAIRLRYWINISEALRGWEKGKPVVIHH